ASVTRAIAELSEADARLAVIIDRVGPCTMLPDRRGTHFDAIARSIVYQQLSGKAAGTIYGRFVERLGAGGAAPAPDRIIECDSSVLRECGLSTAKTAAVRDLAAHVLD